MNAGERRRLSVPRVMALLITMGSVLAGGASAGTLDRIGQGKTIRIAYREDAAPFSYKDKIGEPVGFMVYAGKSPRSSRINCT